MSPLTQEEASQVFRESAETLKALLDQLEVRVVDLEDPHEILLHGRHLARIRREIEARLMRMQLGQPPIDVLDPPSV